MTSHSHLASRSKKAFLGLLSLLLIAGGLSVISVVVPENAIAASASGGNCSVTVNNNSGVAAWGTGTDCFVAFKTTGTSYTWTPPLGLTSIDLLVVAGGGGGASRHGGGGGAGGLINNTSLTIDGSDLSISVGAGGAGGGAGGGNNGANGSNSVVSGSGITTRTAIGGGGGSYGDAVTVTGGSAGGAGCCNNNPGIATAGQGNAGSNGSTNGTSYWIGGGGGGAGAGATAANASTKVAGIGGSGAAISWISTTAQSNLGVGFTSNSSVYFAGGGGGGADPGGSAGSGGVGGGGAGAGAPSVVPTIGTANTGGGGGGSGTGAGGGGQVAGASGGSGVVVIRYTPITNIDSALTFTRASAMHADSNSATGPLQNLTTYTVETWAKPTANCIGAGTRCEIILRAGDYGISLKDGTYQYYIYYGSSQTNFIDTGVPAVAGKWIHLALSRSGTSSIFYINGVSAKTFTVASASASTYTNFAFSVGGYPGTTTENFDGQIDEVKLWNSARTASEIAAGMNSAPSLTDANLLAYYNFNESSGSTVFNKKSGAASTSDLILANSPVWTDVKTQSVSGNKIVTIFPRSYINAAGGWTVPAGVTAADVLVVGGGGGGAGNNSARPADGGGGGGGGGAYLASAVPVSGVSAVTVGSGGAGGILSTSVATTIGNPGKQSAFGTLTAGGGGGGGCAANDANYVVCSSASIQGGTGTAGGGGGGASNFFQAYNWGAGGLGSNVTIGGATYSAQNGFRGGSFNYAGASAGTYSSASSAISSGGAGGPGGGARSEATHNTIGSGLSSTIAGGSAVEYGKGGGAYGVSGWTFSLTSSGYGTGGNGAYNATTATNGGSGASGVVIVSYVAVSGSVAISGTAALNNLQTADVSGVTAIGSPAVSYQWQTSTDNSTWTNGVTTSTFTPTTSSHAYVKVTATYTFSSPSGTVSLTSAVLGPLYSSCTVSSATSGAFTYKIFTNTAQCSWPRTAGVSAVDLLIIAGGGAGGSGAWGGGGGAGELVSYTNYSISSLPSLTIKVGAGGAAGTAGLDPTATSPANASYPGNPSSVDSISAAGGGAGASYAYGFTPAALAKGGDGGSGGGGTEQSSVQAGGSTTKTSSGSRTGYGNNGGAGGPGSSTVAGGGGGGAAGVGVAAATGVGGAGGSGTNVFANWVSAISSSMSAVTGWATATTSGYLAGGGAGGAGRSTSSVGGAGGGGDSGKNTSASAANGSPGVANTGGGGGGASYGGAAPGSTGGAGGSGLVVLRYLTAAPSISSQPSSATLNSGSTASFSVTTGSTPAGVNRAYQWQSSSDSGANFSNVSGATSATYSFTSAFASDNNKQFRVIVTDTSSDSPLTSSTTSSAATLTVNQTYGITLGTITRVAGDTESTIGIATSPSASGTTVTLTVLPKSGMRLKAGTLVATYNTSSTATLTGSGPYTFTMPAYAITVTAEFEASTVVATFKSNYMGGSSDTTQSFISGSSTSLTSSSFTRSGYSFMGWTSNADGTGTAYTDGQSVTLNANTDFYAKWGALPGAPTITSVVSTATQATITWTAPASAGDGTISNYSFEFSIDSGQTWTPLTRTATTSTTYILTGLSNNSFGRSKNQYRVKTITNVGSSVASAAVNGWFFSCATDPSIGNDDRDYLKEAVALKTFISVSGCNINSPTVTSDFTQLGSGVNQTYLFDPATATGTLTIYNAGTTGLIWTLLGSGAQTLVPQFASATNSASTATIQVSNYDNTFTWSASGDGCSATINSSGLISISTYTKQSCNIRVNTSNKSGYTAAYSTAYSGQNRFAVTFNNNLGTGTMPSQIDGTGATLALTTNTFSRAGYRFTGWNTASNGTGTPYADGANFTFTSNITLRAQWVAVTAQVISRTSTSPSSPVKGGTYTPTATSDSGLTVAISIAAGSSAVCSISGGIVTFNSAGSCVIQYDQSGDSTYGAATQITETLTIGKATPTFSAWSGISKTYGDSTFTVTAPTVTGSLAGSFTYSSATTSVISISGTTFTVAGGGSSLITATFTPTDTTNYNTATTTMTVTVAAGTQTITWAPTTALLTTASPATPTAATALGSATISYAVQDAGTTGCSINSGTRALTFTSAGNCVVRATAASTSNYASATKDVTFVITQATVNATFSSNYGTPTTSTQAIPHSIATALTANAFTRSGYTFTGWSANQDGSGTHYLDSQSVTITTDTTFYATWTAIYATGLQVYLDATKTNSLASNSATAWNSIEPGNTSISSTSKSAIFNATPAPGNVDISGNTSVFFGEKSEFASSGAITVDMWIKLKTPYTVVPANQRIATHYFRSDGTSSAETRDWLFQIYNGKLGLWSGNAAGTERYVSGSRLIDATVAESGWLHVGFVQSSNGDVQFYLNGLPDGSLQTGGFARRAISLADLRIGSGSAIPGYVSKFRLYFGGLTADQIRSNFIADAATYSITPSSDANLSGLTISAGTLSPSFAGATTSYSASVPNATPSITVTPTANSTITVNGTAVASGTASGAISLSVGSNTITIIDTAQDGSTQKTYTLTVTRLASRTISIDAGSYTSSYSMTAIAPTLTSTASAGTGTKSYTSSTTGVCTVNSSTGLVAFVSAGTCSITASIAADSTNDGASSASISFTTTLATQTVTWSPTTSILSTASPATPSALATALGSATISYSVTSAGTTSCTVDSTTAVITFSAVGSCTVRATAAATSSYAVGTADVTFVISQVTRAITVTQGTNGTISPGTTNVNNGSNQTFSFTPATGYSVASITVDGTALSGSALTTAIASGYTFSNVTATHTLTATYSANSYTITYKAGSGGSGSDLTQTYTFGTTFALKNLVDSTGLKKANSAISGWSTSNGASQTHALGAKYSTASNLILYPVWTQATCSTTMSTFTGNGSNGTTNGILYRVYKFTTAGVCFWTVPAGVTTIDYLVVGGGGGGGGATDSAGAGGGGGGQVASSTFDLTGISSVVLRIASGGAGGAADRSVSAYQGTQGQVTEIYASDSLTSVAVGGDGGSQARGDYLSRTVGTGGAAQTGSTPARGGANGGNGLSATAASGGGGGGANGAGGTATSNVPGTGGAGISSFISGSSVTFGAGGAGGDGVQSGTGTVQSTLHASANTGNGGRGAGGGASASNPGGDGGSGLVVLRFVSTEYTVTYDYNGATGGNTTLSSSYSLGGTTITLPTPNKMGYTFAGWYADSSLTTAIGGAGASYSPTGATTSLSAYAKWTADALSITYDSRSGTAASGGNASTTSGGTLTALATTSRTGYTFNGWFTAVTGGTEITTSAPHGQTANFTLYAQWTTNTYTITYKAGTGGSGSDLTQTFVYGNTATLKDATAALTKSGYSISGWAATDGGAKARDLSSTYSAAADLILYPVWSANTYTITYKAGTGGSGSDLTQTFVYGNTATLKDATAALTKTGYAISGWSTTNGGSKTNDLSSSYSSAANLNLYPVWSANTYTITYKAGTGGSGSDLTQTFVYGNTATLKDSTAALTKSGYSISGWSTTNGGTKTNDLSSSYSSAADLTLYPVWGPLTYTITYKAGTGGSGSDLTQTFVYGNTATLKDATAALTKTGYAISGWSTTDGGTQNYALSGSYSSAANLNLYPVWGAVTYTITYKRGTNGTGSDVVQTFVYGNTATLGDATTALIRVGYTISGWATTDGGAKSNDLSSSYSSAANLNLYPVWLANTYTVTFDATTNGGTALSPNASSYTVAGSSLTLKTPAGRSGYTASGWYDAPTGGTKIGNAGATGYSPTSDVTLYFQWTPIAYTVTYNGNSNTGGTVPTNASTYNIGNSVTVAGNTNSLVRTGYSFDGWTDNSSGTGTVYTSGTGYTVGSANVAFYAKWSANTYTITYNANGGTGDGSATSDTYTTAGTAVTLPTVGTLEKAGYNFGGWSATTSGSALSGTYTTSADVTLYAKWTIKTITVTYDKGAASSATIASWPTNDSGNYNTSIVLGTPSSQVSIPGVGTYQFSSWKLSGGSATYEAGSSYLLPATNPTLVAQWVQVFEVNYTFNGGTSATGFNYDAQCISGSHLCTNGQSIQADAAPNRAGYTFAGWRDQSGNPIAAGETFNISINSYLLYAQWNAINYNVVYASAGGATTPAAFTKQISQTFAVASGPSRTGYTFGGWSYGNLTYGAGATFTVGTSDVTLTAQWTANVYTIYYDWNGGTGSSTSNASYTVGNSAVTLPVVGDHVKDGYQFAGWSTTSNGTSVGLSFTPTATTTLYALWGPGTYTITYDGNGGTAGSSSASITNGSAATLPTATRTSYVFNGWFTAATGGSLLGAASASFTPTQSRTAYAQWTQLSLSGISPSALTRVGTFGASSSISTSFSGSNADSSVSVSVPAGALPNGTNINLDLVGDFSRASSLISNLNNYIVSIVVSWVASDGTVPDTASGKPVTVVITNSTIKRGMSVYSIAGPTVVLLGTATVNGSITVQLTSDPEVVVAATKPGAPTSVTATTGADATSVISWTAPTSDGGSSLTGYAVTSSGGQTCTTSGATTCTVTGLTNGTAYTFTVKAINAIGQSSASSASSAATPAGATPAPSSPGNSGGNGNSSNGNNGNGNGNKTVIKVEKEGNKSTLTWTTPSSVVVTIESSKGETKTETVVGNSLTLTTPKPGEGYKVSADAPLADGTVFKDYIVATPPTKPAVLTVTDPVGPAVLKAKWKATSTVEKYSVRIAPATGKSTTVITKNTSVPLKLIPGKKYTITVTAIGFGNLKSKVLTKTFIAPKKK